MQNDGIFRKAQKSSAQGNCVEAAQIDDAILVRDSKNKAGPILVFTKAEWRAFLDGAGKGEFDPA